MSRSISSSRACAFWTSRSPRPCASRTIILASFCAARLDLVGESLRREQRVAEGGLAVAVLAQAGLHALEILAEPIDLPQRVFVVVCRLGQEGNDLGPVEAAQRGLEALLAKIERCDAHHAFCRYRSGCGQRMSMPVFPPSPGCVCEHHALTVRLPNIAVPTRTSVAPSSIAASKSWLMPIDRCAQRRRRNALRQPAVPQRAQPREPRARLFLVLVPRRNQHQPGQPHRPRAERGFEDPSRLVGGAPNLVASPARSTCISTSGDAPASAAAASSLSQQFDANRPSECSESRSPLSSPCSTAGGR